MNEKEFGAFLKDLRKKKGLTLTSLGEIIGLTHSYLSLIENGHKGFPQKQTIQKIAHGLNFTYTDLMKEAGILEEVPIEDLLMESKDLEIRINYFTKIINDIEENILEVKKAGHGDLQSIQLKRDRYRKLNNQYKSLFSKIKRKINNSQPKEFYSLIDAFKSVNQSSTQDITVRVPAIGLETSNGIEAVGTISEEEAARRLFDLKDWLELDVDLFYDGQILSEGQKKQIKSMLKVLLEKE